MELLYLFVVVFLSCLPGAGAAKRYKCKDGCSTNPNWMGGRVCGVDGITYLNACIAFCQSVTVLKKGSCEGDNSIASVDDIDAKAVITTSDMNRFIKEQFKFVTKRDPSQFSNGPPNSDRYENNTLSENTSSTSAESESSIISMVRITAEGHEYLAQWDASQFPPPQRGNAGKQGSLVPAVPAPDDIANPSVIPANNIYNHTRHHHHHHHQLRRSLIVIGTDTRSLVSDTTKFPYSAIAEVDYSTTSEGGCSSTLISRNSVLTAGHCTYDYDNQRWNSIAQIAPGRYRSGSSTIEPYGVWAFDYATTMDKFKSKGLRNYDIGVITLKPREVESNDDESCTNLWPGDAVGYVGIDQPVVGDYRLDGSTITGYPADKANGQMWTSGKCSPGWEAAETYFGYHYCDTYPGNSGSAVLTSDNVALGAHGYGFANLQKNGACLMQGTHYNSVYQWSDRDVTLPDTCGGTIAPKPTLPCPCGNVKRRIFRVICFVIFSQACSKQS